MALRIRHPALRAVVVTVCLLIPFCVGTARLYRGMHHLSDVTVAIVNGADRLPCSPGAGCAASPRRRVGRVDRPRTRRDA